MMNAKKHESYKPSGVDFIGDIPENWEVKKFKFVCEKTFTGWTPSTTKSDYFIGNNTWVTIRDMKSKYISESKNQLSSKAIQDTNMRIVKKGSLLFSFKLSVGAVAFTEKDLYTNEAILSIEEDKNICLEYLYYTMPIFIVKNANINIYGAKLLNQELIKNAYIVNPPLNEQKTISDFLNTKNKEIEEFVAEKQKQIGLLEEQKEAIINKAVTKGLDETVEFKESGIEWIGDIPKHWEVKKLKFLADVIGSNVDKLTKPDEQPALLCNYTDVYKNDNITNNIEFMKATATDLEIEKFLIKKDDVIITKDSETADDMAMPAYVAEDFDNVLCGYHLSLIRTYGELKGKFLYYLFTAKDFNIRFELHSNGVTRFGLGSGIIKNTFIAYPALSEQKQIIEYIETEQSKINEIIQQINNEIDLIQEYKISLISEVVTGQIDVR